MIGQTISHYKILEKLGEGGMGVVYKAQDLKLNRHVALKFLPPDVHITDDEKKRFLYEAETAASLDHPNICTIHEVDDSDGNQFIAMAYVEGQCLADLLKTGPIKLEQAIDLATQIAEGLQAAHQKGVVHRDIKSSNIIVTPDGVAKIMDFGLAKRSGRTQLTKVGSTVGTVPYMSPEQARGDDIDHRTDIWSFGVLLYEMLTGRLPFRSDYNEALIYSILNEQQPQPSATRKDVPEFLDNLCMGCLEKDRSLRPQTMKEVAELIGQQKKADLSRGILLAGLLRNKLISVGVPTALFVLIAGWFAWTRFQPTPPAETGKQRIAILPFKVLTGKEELSDWPVVVQTLLSQDLTGVEEIGVVDPVSLNGLLESEFKTTDPVRGADLFGVLRGINIGLIIDGVFLKYENSYKMQTKIINPQTGEITYSFESVIKDPAHLVAAVDTLAEQILNVAQIQRLRSADEHNLRPWVSSRGQNVAAIRAFIQASQNIYQLEYQSAHEYLLRALNLDSGFVAARVWLVSDLVMRGQLADARHHYGILLKLEPKASPFEQAMIHWSGAMLANDPAAQAQALETALRYSPNNNILLVNLAWDKYLLGDVQGALDAVIPAVTMQWRFPPMYALYGKCYAKLGQFENAKRVLLDALSVTPVDPEVYSLLAIIAFREKDSVQTRKYELSNDESSKALGLGEEAALENRGRLAAEIGVYDFAKRTSGQLIQMNSAIQRYHDQLAESLYRTGHPDDALSEYGRALQLDSSWSNAYFMMGTIMEEQGRKGEAVSRYKKFLALDSASTNAAIARKRMQSLQY